jgi:hypothetical protein
VYQRHRQPNTRSRYHPTLSVGTFCSPLMASRGFPAGTSVSRPQPTPLHPCLHSNDSQCNQQGGPGGPGDSPQHLRNSDSIGTHKRTPALMIRNKNVFPHSPASRTQAHTHKPLCVVLNAPSPGINPLPKPACTHTLLCLCIKDQTLAYHRALQPSQQGGPRGSARAAIWSPTVHTLLVPVPHTVAARHQGPRQEHASRAHLP